MNNVNISHYPENDSFVVVTDLTRGQLIKMLNGLLDSLDTVKVQVNRKSEKITYRCQACEKGPCVDKSPCCDGGPSDLDCESESLRRPLWVEN